jgi:hypothetical protein
MKPSVYEPCLYLEQPVLYLPTTGTDIGGRGFGPAWVGDGVAAVSHPTPTAGFTTQFPRRRFTSAAGPQDQELGAHSPAVVAWRGNAIKLGGFYFSARFMVNAIPNTSIRLFVGLSAGAAVCKTAFASTPANTVGLWCDSTDAGNLTILTADATPTPHTTTLQTAQTLTAGTLYEFVMIANPSPSGTPGTIVTNLINVGTDALLTSQNVSVNAPASTAFMAPQIGLSNRGNTAGGDCSLDVISVYLRPNLRLTPLGTP